jgi:hypothetical protein
MRATNGIPLEGFTLLPVDTVNCVQTLKVLVLLHSLQSSCVRDIVRTRCEATCNDEVRAAAIATNRARLTVAALGGL